MHTLNLRLSFLLVLFLVSCDGKKPKQPVEQTKSSVRDLPEIIASGKLVALTDNSSTSYFVYRGQPMGYEYELLSRYAKDRGLALEIKLIEDMDSVFQQLIHAEGDIIAANLTVTKKRQQKVHFTQAHLKTKQVLVQRLPENYRKLWRQHIEDSLVREPFELEGKTVVVRKNSSFYDRLQSLSDEIGGEINIVEASGDLETEDLIRLVAKGDIDFTVADQNVAKLNKRYYPNIDAKTAISFSQKIAWAVRKDSDSLLADINNWIDSMKRTSDYHTIYTKYFLARTAYAEKVKSKYSSKQGSISEYDELIKLYSDSIDWDWRLISSMVYQESHFNPTITSWAGAVGLMQVLPTTAKNLSEEGLKNPKANIRVGCGYLKRMEDFWKRKIPDPNEVKKFALASYNVGLGHVMDAQNLAVKYDKDPNIWEGHVAEMLLAKSEEEYYQDPIVKHGYCRGREPVKYVEEIMERYTHYQNLIP